LGSLWFSLFEKETVRTLFDIGEDKEPIGIVCLGYSARDFSAPPRKSLEDKVRYMD
jgi:nitroreductase